MKGHRLAEIVDTEPGTITVWTEIEFIPVYQLHLALVYFPTKYRREKIRGFEMLRREALTWIPDIDPPTPTRMKKDDYRYWVLRMKGPMSDYAKSVLFKRHDVPQ